MYIRNILISVTIILFISCSTDESSDSPSPLIGRWELTNQTIYENINCSGTSVSIDFTSEELIDQLGYELESIWTANSDGTLTLVLTVISEGVSQSETTNGTWEDKGGSLCIVLEGYDNNDTDDCVDCSDYIINGNTLTVNQTCTTGCNIYEFVKQ